MTETDENNNEQANSDKALNPIEEGKILRDDLNNLYLKLQEERQLIEKATGELALTGKSFGGEQPKEVTQDEKDQESADKFLNLMK